jgi:hypothetical protein
LKDDENLVECTADRSEGIGYKTGDLHKGERMTPDLGVKSEIERRIFVR